MYKSDLVKKKICANGFFYFVYTPCATFIIVTGLLLLCYPDVAVCGVKKGISVCLDTLVPNLFPFMLLSQLAIEMKIFDIKSKAVSGFTKTVFGFPGKVLPIIIFSLIGGFPLGALLIKNAYEKGEISKMQGQRLLLFCVNPGPSFAVTTIGYAMYGSEKTGLIVYFSSVLSFLLLGVLSRFFCENEPVVEVESSKKYRVDFSSVISESVNSSVKGTVNICVWVIIFSCIGELTNLFNFSEETINFIRMITEVTNGVYCAASDYDLPIVCSVIGFAGLCLHVQVLPSIMKLKLKYRYFLVSRIIAAAFNCIICYILIDLFPQSVTAITKMPGRDTVDVSSSVPLCICLMLLCGLFIGGESLTSVCKKNKSSYTANKTHLY